MMFTFGNKLMINVLFKDLSKLFAYNANTEQLMDAACFLIYVSYLKMGLLMLM